MAPAFQLYIPHLGRNIPERMVYAVLRNMGLGYMSKQTRDETGKMVGAKAVTLIERSGRGGKPDFKSAIVSFDRLFTRGEDNAGNQQILDHLGGGTMINPGTELARYVGNDIQIVYQEAGEDKRDPEAPARYWKAYLYRPEHQRELSVSTKSSGGRSGRPRVVFGTPQTGAGGSRVKAVKFSGPETGGSSKVKAVKVSGPAPTPAPPSEPAYSPESPSYEPTQLDSPGVGAAPEGHVHLVRSDSGELRAL